MEEILNQRGKISLDMPFCVSIKDEIEGDMTFNFKLKEDEHHGSYTTYEAHSSSEATLTISNVKDNGISSQKIPIGTYKGKFTLYTSFIVYRHDNNWIIDVKFFTKEVNNGDKK